MNNKRFGIHLCKVIAAAAVLTAGTGTARDLQQSFAWRASLEGPHTADRLYRAAVTPEIFDGCESFPHDLRILDREGTQWPFYVWEAKERTHIKPYPSEILNQSLVEGPEPHLRIELKVQLESHPIGARHDHITIETPGKDFIRKVEVLGSRDRSSWGLLSSGFLIDYQKPSRVTNRLVRYPRTDHPFVQLRIYPNARTGRPPSQVIRVAVEGRQVEFSGTWEAIPVSITEITDKKHSPGVRVYQLDTGYARRPAEKLTLHTTPGDFFRFVRVYGRHLDTDEWQVVQSSEIHRVGEKENSTLHLPGSTYRYYKLVIHNYDDEPVGLEAVSAKATTRYLVYEAQSASSAAVYFGDPGTQEARYDLRRRKGILEAEKAPRADVGSREANRDFRAPLIDPWLPWIGGVAVALVSMMVVWIIVRMLKTGGFAPE